MKVYLDVGANNGDSMLHHAGDEGTVYAFEPTPKMARDLVEKTKDIENYHVVDKAVADYNGKSTFFISGVRDWGCSSLNTFNDNLDKTWPGRPGFVVTERVEVDVIRLDGFIVEHNIREIEFFHCSTQGKDMEVLLGIGAHIMKIKQGQITMPTSHDTKLYKDSKYISGDATRFLEQIGFKVDKTVYNDHYRNEERILFSRNSEFHFAVPEIKSDVPENKSDVPENKSDVPENKLDTSDLRVAIVFSGRATCYDDSYEWFNKISEKYAVVDFYCSLSTELDEYYQKLLDLHDIKKYTFGNKPADMDPGQDANSMSMFYNLKLAVGLVPSGDYDIILYARTDIVCTQDIDLSVAAKHPDSDNVVFIPSNYDYHGINDQMAFGTPTAMVKYSRVIDKINDYIQRGNLLVGNRPEKILKVHLDASKLNAERFELEYFLNPYRKDISLKQI